MAAARALAAASSTSSKSVLVRQVWADNLEAELLLIHSILGQFHVVAMDTEFPGTIYKPENHLPTQLHPTVNYSFMKANVDELKIIQLGLTISDRFGNLPDFGTKFCYIWEFNFRDFDIDHDPYDPSSVKLLEGQGIDFRKNREKGIHTQYFGKLFLKSGMVLNHSRVAWLTFHGSYDFAYLIKILTWQQLPQRLDLFIQMVQGYFGVRVYDLKSVSESCCRFYGGLERLAKDLKVERVAGKSHQAGSDSLLTLQTFMSLQERFDGLKKSTVLGTLNGFEGVLYGLHIPKIRPIQRIVMVKFRPCVAVYVSSQELERQIQRHNEGLDMDGKQFIRLPGINIVYMQNSILLFLCCDVDFDALKKKNKAEESIVVGIGLSFLWFDHCSLQETATLYSKLKAKIEENKEAVKAMHEYDTIDGDVE
ncbi:hypothetical protein HS088_TW11G00672 [Tripterygium wilfordii]|uniref:poly(A)-specific ribonuclease n=1 Tax=Tripterygium wilfordii TaxID=458696 RepID=A0A7J7D3F2_TRIWF|nr:hypothetical protein HS088_TW11G00672 [Tripterygium wilfordii]